MGGQFARLTRDFSGTLTARTQTAQVSPASSHPVIGEREAVTIFQDTGQRDR